MKSIGDMKTGRWKFMTRINRSWNIYSEKANWKGSSHGRK